MNGRGFYSFVIAIVVIGGIAIGIAYNHSPYTNPSTQTQGPYQLNLVEVMDANFGGSAGAQPKYYADENGSLQSTANMTLPSHTLVIVTIISYDMGNASVGSQYLYATGLVGSSVQVISGSVASGSNTSLQWSTNVSMFPASKVLHTFTILSGANTLINIPVMAGSTEIASFYINGTGSYTWQCEAACGTGSTGWGGPMSAAGWMEGSLYVY